MGQTHSFRAPPESSSEFCSSCGGTGFRAVAGGVVSCDCRQGKPTPKPPSPSPTPIAACSIPPAVAKNQLNQCQRLILFLRKRGDKGATNVELATFLKLLRYSSRIFSCRKSGYVIEAVEKGDGIWVYFLRHEPAVESPPYVFQQPGPTEEGQPKVLVGVTAPLFASVPGER